MQSDLTMQLSWGGMCTRVCLWTCGLEKFPQRQDSLEWKYNWLSYPDKRLPSAGMKSVTIPNFNSEKPGFILFHFLSMGLSCSHPEFLWVEHSKLCYREKHVFLTKGKIHGAALLYRVYFGTHDLTQRPQTFRFSSQDFNRCLNYYYLTFMKMWKIPWENYWRLILSRWI